MKTIVYNKLVRDFIPEIIRKSGKMAVCETVDGVAYLQALDEKLLEELTEYQNDKSLEELADMCEVIRAIVLAKGFSLEEFDAIREKKAEKRGGFEKRLFLKEVIGE